jgi:hypothetical protein
LAVEAHGPVPQRVAAVIPALVLRRQEPALAEARFEAAVGQQIARAGRCALASRGTAAAEDAVVGVDRHIDPVRDVEPLEDEVDGGVALIRPRHVQAPGGVANLQRDRLAPKSVPVAVQQASLRGHAPAAGEPHDGAAVVGLDETGALAGSQLLRQVEVGLHRLVLVDHPGQPPVAVLPEAALGPQELQLLGHDRDVRRGAGGGDAEQDRRSERQAQQDGWAATKAVLPHRAEISAKSHQVAG